MGNLPVKQGGKPGGAGGQHVDLKRLWQVMLQVWVPAEDIPLVIGKGGAFVKRIRDETNARVDVVRVPQFRTLATPRTHVAGLALRSPTKTV